MRASSPCVRALDRPDRHAWSTADASPRRCRRVLIPVGAALVALLFPAVHRPALRLVWNATASVPVGLYRIAPGDGFRPGELVAVRPVPALARLMAERRYVEADALLVKPIAAVAGQQVCRAGASVTINGALVATALGVDHLHRPLPVWTGCVRLRAGTAFLLARTSPASFDSRYFGPIATISIVGRALPIWTRP